MAYYCVSASVRRLPQDVLDNCMWMVDMTFSDASSHREKCIPFLFLVVFLSFWLHVFNPQNLLINKTFKQKDTSQGQRFQRITVCQKNLIKTFTFSIFASYPDYEIYMKKQISHPCRPLG